MGYHGFNCSNMFLIYCLILVHWWRKDLSGIRSETAARALLKHYRSFCRAQENKCRKKK